MTDCALKGYRIKCYGDLQWHHIIPKSWARGNPEVRKILKECPPEIMAWVCEAHNTFKWADHRIARKILIEANEEIFGDKVRKRIDSLPWKVKLYQYTYEGIMS